MTKIIDIIVPDTEQEGTVSIIEKWFKQPGDPMKIHEPVLEINTDKVSMEIPAPADGVLLEILKHENEEVHPGEILGRMKLAGEAAGKKKPVAPERQKSPASQKSESGGKRLSPVVKRMLQTHNIDASRINGTGRGGRITIKDVEAFLAARETASVQTPPSQGITGRLVPHSRMRKQIAEHMVQSMLKTAPHVTAVFDADMTAVMAHRREHKAEFAEKGVNLTFTAYFVQAAVKALQAVPQVNSRWHDDGLEIFEDCNIGIATALDDGLIVPVLHRAQTFDLFTIAEKLQDLTHRARQSKLEPDEVQNGTFTITNHGVSGSLIATPIINQPQTAILGIGKMEKRLVVEEENCIDIMKIKPMIYVTLTIDHRALDGFTANTFLNRFVEALSAW